MEDVKDAKRVSRDKEEKIREKIQQVSKTLEYPVRNLDDLVAKLGNEFDIYTGSTNIKLRHVKTDIPRNFFPINNDRELIQKGKRLFDEKRRGT